MISYERIIQWLAGPVAVLAGWAATQLVGTPDGAQHDQLAAAVSQIGEFGVGAGVTYLAHHKFLTNVAQWWNHQAYAAATTTQAPLVTHDAPVVAHDAPVLESQIAAVVDEWPEPVAIQPATPVLPAGEVTP